MTEIVTLAEFASAIRKDMDVAAEHMMLLELADGLVVAELGDQDPWPAVAKATVLAAASRAYFNPDGVRQETVGGTSVTRDAAEAGVYLTESELQRLRRWIADNVGTGKPTYEFPGTWPFPDRVEREPDAVTG